jgi:hypothetical protein
MNMVRTIFACQVSYRGHYLVFKAIDVVLSIVPLFCIHAGECVVDVLACRKVVAVLAVVVVVAVVVVLAVVVQLLLYSVVRVRFRLAV